ncbi:MAG: autoinducer binding domain-containing protein [Planctomycetota bacterium]
MISPITDFQKAGEVLETLSRLSAPKEKFDHFANYLARQGFTDVFYAQLMPGGSEPIIMRRWDEEWAEIYQAKRYAQWDWALQMGQRSERPFRLRQPITVQSKGQAEFQKDAEAYNRLNGLAAPFRSPTSGAAGFSASGLDHEPGEGVMLAAVSTGYVFNICMIGQIASDRCKVLGVTPRQLMFLRLLGEGHTHVEIADLLGVTEDWSHKIFGRLREKFEVRTDAALMKKVVEAGLLAG